LKSEIIINAITHETRISIIENGKLVEVWVERPDNERMVGDIYLGKVKAVIPGIQAAFVDIGMEKSAFLHVSDVSDASIDFAAQYDDEDDDEDEDEEPAPKRGRGGHGRGRDKKMQPIETVLTKDQELFVQVTKEPISTKGARLTSQVTLPGRFLVLMPGAGKIGVSRRIASWNERKRLRQIAKKYQPKGIGLIIRTVAEGKDEETIGNEIKELVATYEELVKRAENAQAPALLNKAMGMTSGIIRDLLSEDVERVVVDSKEHYEDIRHYLQGTSPNLMKKVSLYEGKEPIFDHYGLEREIESIFSRKVWLRTGAFLVLDHTEALTVIDVNSGRNVGKSNQEETIRNINIESAIEIARQLRLRDIGGIIVIDFIDMADHKNRKLVEDTFADALKNDRSKISISQISEFGLMEMTRQRVRPSLIFTFAESCPTCNGIGMVQSRDTTMTKIERWLARAEAFGKESSYTVFVHPAVFEYLIENDQERLKRLHSCTRLTIDIVADSKINIDEFHFFSTTGGEVTDDFSVGSRHQDDGHQKNGGQQKKKADATVQNDSNNTQTKYGRKPKPKRR
jgi:ribonuclease G